jgi:hypothetical protein
MPSSEARMLGAVVNQAPSEDLLLKLYSSDTWPRKADSIERYTEVQGFGYAPVKLRGSAWTVVEGPPAHTEYPEQTFVFTGPLGRVFGYLLVQEHSGMLVLAERFSDGPYHVVYSGTQIRVVPGIEMDRPRPELVQ